MRLTYTLAAGATWAALALAGPAHAGGPGSHPLFRPHRALPPVSGTLHVNSDAFWHLSRLGGWTSARGHGEERGIHAHPRHLARDYSEQGGGFKRQARGYAWYAPHPSRHETTYGPAYGDQENAYTQLHAGRAGYGYDDWRASRAVGWRGDGTGLVGLIGGNDDSANADWNGADSATPGGADPMRSRRYRAEAPVQVTYGEPDLWASGPGYAPTGGLAYYSSGSPGRLAYYGSSSSAGPNGTPGGLGIYSSGSYGFGPRIIHIGRQHSARMGRDEVSRPGGPHIIYLRHRRDHYARW